MNRNEEREAVEALVRKYEKSVYRLAYSYMKNRHDTDDIYQEVFLRYFRKKPEFESEEHEKAWFIRTTVNCCKSYFRSGWFQRTTSLDERTKGQEDSYEIGEHNELLEAVMALPTKYRMAVHLFYYEGYSVQEIAELTGEKVTTVTTRLNRAREKLRDLLDDGEFSDLHMVLGRVKKEECVQ